MYKRIIINNEFGTKLKEVVVTYFSARLQNVPKWISENRWTVSQKNLFRGHIRKKRFPNSEECQPLLHNIRSFHVSSKMDNNNM
jgi:hypothetical protein